MKANELMVGDWIADKDGDKVRVENIINSEFDCYYGIDVVCMKRDGRCSRWTVDFEDAQPIPLTAEILEKNGFEELMSESKGVAAIFGRKVEHTGVWMYCIPDTFDSVFYVPERKLLRLKVMEGGITDLHNLQYVHELQHFLRLYGIENEIEL